MAFSELFSAVSGLDFWRLWSWPAVISFLALVLSLFTWMGQRKLQRESNNTQRDLWKLQRDSNEMQRATSELSEKQLEILLREEKGKNSARLSLLLVQEGKNFFLVLKNVSEAEASHIELSPILQRAEDNPVIASEYAEKFPLKKLPAGAEVRLHAVIYQSSPSVFNFRMSWKNPDGTGVDEEAFVYV